MTEKKRPKDIMLQRCITVELEVGSVSMTALFVLWTLSSSSIICQGCPICYSTENWTCKFVADIRKKFERFISWNRCCLWISACYLYVRGVHSESSRARVRELTIILFFFLWMLVESVLSGLKFLILRFLTLLLSYVWAKTKWAWYNLIGWFVVKCQQSFTCCFTWIGTFRISTVRNHRNYVYCTDV